MHAYIHTKDIKITIEDLINYKKRKINTTTIVTYTYIVLFIQISRLNA
jgi:hypothetical protein